MKYFTAGAAIVLMLGTTSCAIFDSPDGDFGEGRKYAYRAPPMDPNRTVSERDCHRAFNLGGGNLRCM